MAPVVAAHIKAMARRRRESRKALREAAEAAIAPQKDVN
jgi:hypothetical protein